MAKSEKRLIARELRKSGESIKAIAKQLQVSQSSVSAWCRDVKLTEGQILELERRARDPLYGRRLDYSLRRQKEREDKTKRLLSEGINEIGKLTQRELFLVGVALYWAEGFKKDNRVGFANTDPEMVRLFIKWLTESCGYKKEDLSLRVTLNASHRYRIDEVQKFWSQLTGAPKESFQKPYFQEVKWKKIYDNSEKYHGVLRIRVRKSKDFLQKIHGWIEGLKIVAKKESISNKRNKDWFLKYAGSWKGTYLDSDEFWEGILTKDSKPIVKL